MPADPSQVPLPQTPVKQNEPSIGVFGPKGSRYMHDSHMENEASRPTPNTYKGPAQQPDRRYDLNEDSSNRLEEKNSTPRIEITTHLPLGNIKAFSGYRNKSEKSMQYYSAKREDKEHVCDYLNRLNGYARNAGVQFENGGREAKDHVEHFLNTCDDRGLEERLCHVRVKDIHDLEDMINDILKRRDRKSKRESSVRRSTVGVDVTTVGTRTQGATTVETIVVGTSRHIGQGLPSQKRYLIWSSP
ncbi:hypothetical protein PHMEG_00035647, partial [Phytophthora megakarya]